jgi:uncharacterized protein
MKIKIAKNPIVRVLLKVAGFTCISLGTLGILLPVLPTTPFLILAAICFSYSSEKFYKKIINHPKFGRSVLNYLEGRGIPKKAKKVAVTLLWISLMLSVSLVTLFWLKVMLPTIGIYVTWFILKEPDSEKFSGS